MAQRKAVLQLALRHCMVGDCRVVGDAFGSPMVYGIVSGIIFVVIAIRVYFLRRSGEQAGG
jgi:hypothetical protein